MSDPKGPTYGDASDRESPTYGMHHTAKARPGMHLTVQHDRGYI